MTLFEQLSVSGKTVAAHMNSEFLSAGQDEKPPCGSSV